MAEGEVAAINATAASTGKVRVVRCPKCQKLLPELAGFTVYRCGGCGTTLQAKHAVPVADTSSEKSDEERVLVVENDECCLAREKIASKPSPEYDPEREKAECRGKKWAEAGNTTDSFLSATGNGSSKEPDQSRLHDLRDGSRHADSSRSTGNICTAIVDEMVKPKMEKSTQIKQQGDKTYRSQKLQNNSLFNYEERDGLGVLRRTPRALLEGGRFSPYPHEGPSSSYPISSIHCRDDNFVRTQKVDKSERIESLEQDRVDLLRKLDELRDQLSRSCDVKGKANERDSMDKSASSIPYGGRQNQGPWVKNSLNSRTSTQQFPLFNGHNMDVPNFCAPENMQNEVPRYGDSFDSRQLRRGPFCSSHHYPHRAAESYMYGRFEPDPLISYPQNIFYHHPPCSCPHCYNTHWQPSVPSASVFSNHRAPFFANSYGTCPVVDPLIMGSSNFDHRGTNGSWHSHDPQIEQRPTVAKQSERSCRPLSGGAPFVICSNCNELLQMPNQLSSLGTNHCKLQCGSCSEVISFNIEGKRLNIFTTPSVMNRSVLPTADSPDVIARSLQCPGPSNHTFVNSCTGECEGSIYNVKSTGEKLASSPPLLSASHEAIEKEYGLNLSDENILCLSSSPSTSEDNDSIESMICQREGPSSTELQQTQANPHGPGLPLREHFRHSSSDQVVCKAGEGSRSKHFDQEKTVAGGTNFKQNSIKNACSIVEKYPNPCQTQDSLDVFMEEDHCRMNKGGDSFFAGLIKKSFKDFPLFNQMENNKPKVLINGHHIPDRLVKKAEKLAGPIYPGEYWYDYEAGFWGVMEQPCIGIIPPLIEEFKYPMPKKCSGGNTGVIVNGRELHQKDLDLLVGRGLPSDNNRSYRVDIAGRVLDEASGEELDSLGKLAPTVEKLKRGFGLRVPRVHAV